jgi:hypothetical protein
MSDRLALANAIEDAGIPRDKAQRVASVIFDAIHDNVATKADVQAGVAAVRSQLQTSEAALRSEIVGVRSMLAAETARLDTRIEWLDAAVKAQREHAAPGHSDGGADRHHPGRPALPAAATRLRSEH